VFLIAQKRLFPVSTMTLWITRLIRSSGKKWQLTVALTCADHLHLGEQNRVLESMDWQRVSVGQFNNLKGDKQMLKRILIVATLALLATLTAVASDREDDVKRTHKAAQVFKEIMNTPDRGIPHDLLNSAKCIAIIPGDKKFAFIFGGNYGRGLATCRTGHGWSAPMFVAIEGGSVGYQIGGSSTDIVMLFMNDHALQSLLSDKFKLGADASVAAGPVGRSAAAGTDIKLNAEILSYSRAKGVFAGVALDGAVVQADKSGDEAMYGHDVNRHEILDGKVAVPASARPLLHEIGKYIREAKAK
jgi:SH3 domain-containing YSC84-like protein 1